MNVPINSKRLRSTLPDVVERVRKRTRLTVIYRSRPAFQVVPVDDHGSASIALADDTLYRAQSVGSSEDGRTSIDRDAIDNHFSKVGFDVLPAVRRQATRKPLLIELPPSIVRRRPTGSSGAACDSRL